TGTRRPSSVRTSSGPRIPKRTASPYPGARGRPHVDRERIESGARSLEGSRRRGGGSDDGGRIGAGARGRARVGGPGGAGAAGAGTGPGPERAASGGARAERRSGGREHAAAVDSRRVRLHGRRAAGDD